MQSIKTICQAIHQRPADYRDNLPAQQEFLDANERKVVWFGHNGGGKTEALCRRLVRVFDGLDHICHQGKKDLTILLVVTNYDAASARDLADQLHALCPPGLIAQVPMGDDGRPTARCSPWYGRGKGFRGRPPRVVVQRGPMKGTTLNVSTLGAGELAAAGITADLILVNEPITRALMDELGTRDRAGALGFLWYVLTPIPGAPDQTWIPEYAEDIANAGGSIRYIKTPLTRAALVFPSGRPLESWDEKTAPRIASWDPISRPMRMGESLEPIFDDGYFAAVWREELIIESLPHGLNLWLVGSIDHSIRDGRMRIGVTGYNVQGRADSRQLVGYDLIDVKAGGADIDEAANLFLLALADAGIPLESIDQWVGDRSTTDRAHLIVRDNREFMRAILRALRSPRWNQKRDPAAKIKVPRELYDIKTPKKWNGSSWHNMSQMRSAMAAKSPRLYIMRRCVHIIEDIQRWDGRKQSPHKDGLDRLGYSWEAAHRRHDLWRQHGWK
jgi:hypothetical protein